MASHLSSPSATKYFTQPWTITTPSHPTITFHRGTPSDIPNWLPLITNPLNNAFMSDTKDTVWDNTEINKWTNRIISSYNNSLSRYNDLSILISESGKFIGYGDLFLLKSGAFNVGVVLDASVHGRGIGRLSTAVFVQLGFEIGRNGVSAGTMKANGAMRGVMRSLGVEEVEDLVVVEGRGVLAELLFVVERERWKDVKLDVVWGENELKTVDKVD